CMAVWDLGNTYLDNGRGQDCTSADGAGFPIAPLLFNADEVAAGSIDHAIRFILPNSRIRDNIYVHPATHSTGPTIGPPQAPPYGAHLRLRADFPLASLDSEAERVIARAMLKYGMFLADGGTVALVTTGWGTASAPSRCSTMVSRCRCCRSGARSRHEEPTSSRGAQRPGP